jgi:hypothetical protein
MVTLIILGYILMGVITAVCIHKIFPEQERFDCVAFGFIWPITIAFGILVALAMIPVAIISLMASGWEELELWNKCRKNKNS